MLEKGDYSPLWGIDGPPSMTARHGNSTPVSIYFLIERIRTDVCLYLPVITLLQIGHGFWGDWYPWVECPTGLRGLPRECFPITYTALLHPGYIQTVLSHRSAHILAARAP